MRDQLIGLQNGGTFEEVRRRYIATVDRLVAEGLGGRTTSSLDLAEPSFFAAAHLC
jgi:hypothetical protein